MSKITKSIGLILIAFLILSIAFGIYNNNPKIILSRLLRKGDIQLGQLKYRVYLLGVLPVGEAVLGTQRIEEYQGLKVYHLSATAKSLEIFSKFFSGFAVLDSYVDLNELNPIAFRQKLIVSGKEDIDREIIYDQKNNVMTIAGVKRQIMPDTQDHLSAFFNIRQMNFDRAKEIEMNINTNQKNYILEGTVESKEILINRKARQIYILKADIRRRDKNPYHQTNISMIMLREKQNIPILIKVFASGILINARLIDIK